MVPVLVQNPQGCGIFVEIRRPADLVPLERGRRSDHIILGNSRQRVASEDKLFRQIVPAGKIEEDGGHLVGIARLGAGIALRHLHDRADGRFVFRQQRWDMTASDSRQFVRMLPGSMATAVTPNGLTSLASEAVKPLTAHLAAV